MNYKIAIDGPSGVGKSAVARILSKELNFLYVDTGAIYRAIGLFALRRNCLEDENRIVNELKGCRIKLKFDKKGQRIFLNGEEVTAIIRGPEVSNAASVVSVIPWVRKNLFCVQRKLAQTQNVIMDGRDIGTVIMKDADVKIFLTANLEQRAKRRQAQLAWRCEKEIPFDEVCKEIVDRDQRDSERSTAPLKIAKDAVVVDNSNLTKQETIDVIKNIIYKKINIERDTNI